MKKHLFNLLLLVAMCLPWAVQAQVTLPFTCDFEDDVTEWNFATRQGSNTWYIGTAEYNSGSQSLYVSNDQGTTNAYSNGSDALSFAYVAVDLEASDYQISFDWKCGGESTWDFCRVALVSSTVDFTSLPTSSSNWSSTLPSGWIAIDGGLLNLSGGSWNTCEAIASSVPAGSYYLVFVWRNDGSTGSNPPIAIDNISFSAVSCPQPANLVLDAIDSASATISWTAGGSETSWLISVNNLEAFEVSDPSYTFEELTPNTNYTVSVRANCGGEDVSASTTIFFRTDCGETVLPLVQNFEEDPTYDIPSCWTRFESYESWSYTYPYVYDWGTPHSGTNCLYFSPSNGTQSIATPKITSTGNPLDVIFYGIMDCPSLDSYDVQVGYATDASDPSTFHNVQTVSLTDVMNSYTVSFADVDEENGFYVVIRVPEEEDYNYPYIYLDDITVREASSCVDPTRLRLAGTASGEVTLAWTDSIGSAWDIAYGPRGCDPYAIEDILTDIYENPFTVTDLSNDETYDFYVRSNCGGETSYWVGPLTARPNVFMMPATGSDTITGCGFTLTDNGGINGEYSNNCNGIFVIYPSSEDSTIRLTGSFNTENNYDKIYLYEGVGIEGASLGVYMGTGDIDTFSTVGPITVKFTSDGSGQYDGFVLQVSCEEKASCPDPYGLAITNAAVTSALASWRYNYAGGTPTEHLVTVTDTATGTVFNFTADTTFYQITGLTAGTTYRVDVETVCETGDHSSPISIYFSTKNLPCGGADTTTMVEASLFDGLSRSTYFPSYDYFKYSFSQQIYRSEELNDMGRITGLKFKVAEGSATRQLSFYLSHTPEVSANAYVNASTAIEVWSGSVSFAPDSIIDINFTTPFTYNGSDNLLLTIIDATGSYVLDNHNAVYVHNNGTFNSIYANSDNTQYSYDVNPGSPTVVSDRMNIIWKGNPCTAHISCVAPTVVVSNVSTNAVDLTWTAGFDETSWNVEYRSADETEWNMAEAATSTTDYSLVGLTANTSYFIRITSLCGDENASTVVSVTTPCDAIEDFPFVENFDNGFIAPSSSIGLIESCWFRGTSYSYQAYPYINNYDSYNGSSSMNFEGSYNYYSYLALPRMGVALDSLQVSFASFIGTRDYYLQVGVMTDPTDFNTFRAVSTITPDNTSDWCQYEVSFANYTGNAQYIAFAIPEGSYSAAYVDAITVDYAPACARPTNVTLDSASTTSLFIHWDSTSAESYEIEYGPQGFTLGQGLSSSSEVNSVELTGLSASQVYDVYVRGNCGAESSNWSFVKTFATACGNLENFPYHENFDNWDANNYRVPLCWTASGSYPEFSTYLDRFNNGQSLEFYMNNKYAMLPALGEGINANQMMVAFSANANDYTGMALAVGVSTTAGDISTFTPIDTIEFASDADWHDYEVMLDSYEGEGAYITFKYILENNSYASLYIDELYVEPIPTCVRVDSLDYANVTANSVDLSWHERGTANQWQVEYAPVDNPSAAVRVTTSNNPINVTGLAPSTTYTFNVRAICAAGDTSYFARTPGSFTTAQIPATLPYTYDFETADEWNNWQTAAHRSDAGWFRGNADAAQGSYSMYISADNGATVSTREGSYPNYSNFVAYRDVDFGASDTSFSLQFKAKCGGDVTGTYDGLAIFLADPADPVVYTEESAIVTPWGSLNDLDMLALVRLDTNWSDYTFDIDRIHGVQRLVFCYFNQYLDDFIGGPAEVDSISIKVASCPRPTDLTLLMATTTTASLAWNGPADADYEITYRPYPGSVADNQVVTSTTNNVTLTGLQTASQYAFWVRKICGEGDTSNYSDGYLFRSSCFDGPVSTFPFVEEFDESVECWGQEYVQGQKDWQVANGVGYEYYSGDITGAFSGDGNAFFQENSSTSMATRLISPMLNLGGASNMKLSFAYAIPKWVSDYDEMSVYYRNSPDSAWTLLSSYTEAVENWATDTLDLPNPTATYQVAFEATTHYGYGVLVDHVVIDGDVNTCSAPTVYASNVTYESFTAHWEADHDSCEVVMTDGAWFEPLPPALLTADSITFDNLMPSTTYTIGVRQICGEGVYSEWTTLQVTTDELPCFAPENLHAVATTYFDVQLAWSPVGNETSWNVRIFNGTYDSIYTANATTATFGGLQAGVTYQAQVRAMCGSSSQVTGDWSEPAISFTTNTCVPVSNVTVVSADESSITLDWTAGDESAWEIQYSDDPDFGTGEGFTVNATSHPFQVTGLDANTDYYFYVYAKCTETLRSDASARVSGHTRNVGINNVDASASISIYPNPTSDVANITVSGVEGNATVAIVDMNGRTVRSMQISGDAKLTVEGLAQGAYFVRIVSENVNSVKKLIVR